MASAITQNAFYFLDSFVLPMLVSMSMKQRQYPHMDQFIIVRETRYISQSRGLVFELLFIITLSCLPLMEYQVYGLGLVILAMCFMLISHDKEQISDWFLESKLLTTPTF